MRLFNLVFGKSKRQLELEGLAAEAKRKKDEIEGERKKKIDIRRKEFTAILQELKHGKVILHKPSTTEGMEVLHLVLIDEIYNGLIVKMRRVENKEWTCTTIYALALDYTKMEVVKERI